MPAELDQSKSVAEIMADIGVRARAAARTIAIASAETKSTVLLKSAEALERNSESILAANAKDLAAGKENGLSKSMLDRLLLD